jgi:uncharacterized protein
LAQFAHGAILDEFQRAPELASYIQELVDTNPQPGQFILTGSHSFSLMRGLSQSLAGRTALLELWPLTLAEQVRLRPAGRVQPAAQAIFNGFYPRVFDRSLDPSSAMADYFATYVDRDLRELAAVHDLQRFERFVRLCAGRIGQVLNLSSLGNDAGC